jgi:hypothetical protein
MNNVILNIVDKPGALTIPLDESPLPLLTVSLKPIY